MKLILMMAASLGLAPLAQATLFESGGSVGTIPKSAMPAQFIGTITQPSGFQVTGLTVDLTVSGGLAGGFYAFLVAPDGTMVILLNQPGVTGDNLFGNLTAGLNLRLSDSGTTITAGSNLAVGTASPHAAHGSLSNFGTVGTPGVVAEGDWSLYFGDLAGGAGTATLESWSLNLMVVPEPVTLAMGIFGAILGLLLVIRQRVNLRRIGGRITAWLAAV